MRSGDLLIVNGLVAGPSEPRTADVRVRQGSVVEIGADLAPGDEPVVDATGCWVGPGFVDIHTHLREPGQEHKEDISSGSRAAAAGGYTAIVAMPNTLPAMDTAELASFVRRRGAEVGLVEVVPSGTVTIGRKGDKVAPIDELWGAGVRMFTDDGDAVADSGVMRDAMDHIGRLGGVVSQHAVDPGLARGGCMHEGAVAARLGVRGVPAVAEEIVIRRDMALVRLTGARYHVQHLSTAGAIEAVAAAKAEGLPVTAEVTPHHLAFDESELEQGDTTFKMMPPLRTPADVAAVRGALASGVIDAVATDHAPHSPAEKAVSLEEAPPGVTGLEWAAAVVNTVVGLDIRRFFERMATAPAAIARLDDGQGRPVEPGSPANLVVFDPESVWVPASTRSRSRNSPYLGRPWQGVVRATVYNGVITYMDGEST